MIRFGTNPIAWTNDDDRSLGADIPLEQCLREAGEIGFDGIGNGHRFPQDPAALKAALEPDGLAFASAWYSLEMPARSVDEEKRAIQSHLDRLTATDCKVCIACTTSNAIPGDPARPISQRPTRPGTDFGRTLEQNAAFTADQGLTLVYPHHMGTVVQSPEEMTC